MTPPTATADRAVETDLREAATATWGGDTQSLKEQVALAIFIVVPFLAVAAAVPVAWGGWLGWTDIAIMASMYWISGHGITVGFHRLFTHKSFKPNRAVKIALAIAGSLAVQGPVIRWVADHRKHHKFSDRDGDPHSPWRYGTDLKALTKGFLHAHMMWLFNPEQTPQRKYAPDLMKDRDLVRISKQFPLWVFVSMATPLILGGLITMSWQGALTGFFWGSLVRVSLLHHVTWSINSICHTVGARPFVSRDKSANVWWLAIPSMGESWHNLHHADPTCARHGVMRGQLDTTARVIWALEKLGWVDDVRWPVKERIDARLVVDQLPELPDSSDVPATWLAVSRRPRGHDGTVSPAADPDNLVPLAAADRRKRTPRSRMTAAERREQLIAIARGLFAERGFDGTSIEEIAAHAEVSKPVVYEHFGGKEGLYAVVVDREVRSLLTMMQDALTAGNPRMLLEQAAIALLDYIEQSSDGFRILVRDSPIGSASGSFVSIIGDIASRVEHILAGEFKARGFDAKSAPMYAQMLVGMVGTLGQWWLDERTPSKEQVAAHLVNLAWNGLAGMEKQPTLRTEL